MNQTTESAVIDAAKTRRLQTIIVWCVIVLCGILIPSIFFRSYNTTGGFFLSPFPWVIVGGMTIEHGLQMNSGTIPEIPSIATQLGCLGSILIVFVIGPTLFFFGIKSRAVERAAGKELSVFRWSTLQVVLGGMVTLGLALISIPTAIIQREVSSNLHKAQTEAENRDAILYEMNSIALKLYEYRVLPKELGGGSGSFAGFTLGKDLSTTSDAQYTLELQDTLAIAKATSVKYPLGTVTATINRQAKFSKWQFSELFN